MARVASRQPLARTSCPCLARRANFLLRKTQTGRLREQGTYKTYTL